MIKIALRLMDGCNVLWMPQSRESLALRVMHTLCDVVRDDPQHGMGWTRWHERVFYRGDDDIERPLSQIWEDQPSPRELGYLVAAVQFLDRFLVYPRFRAVSGHTSEQEAGL